MKAPPNLAYALLRFTMGIDLFLHGATRIASGLGNFSGTVVREFETTILPPWFVHSFAVTLPFLEGLVGLLLLVGLFTRFALIFGGLLMAALVFGTALRSEWNTIGLQLIYAVIFYLLLSKIENNCCCLDGTRAEPSP